MAGYLRIGRKLLAVGLVLGMLLSPSAAQLTGSVQSAAAQSSGATLLAVVSASGASLSDAPDGAAVSELAPGAVLTAVGRTADGKWLQVTTETNESGWVESSSVVAFGLDKLPTVSAEPTPTPTVAPTATPTQAPTPTPAPTATPTVAPKPTAKPAQAAATPAATSKPGSSSTGATGAAAIGNLIAVVGAGGADLYDQPQGDVIKTVPPAEALTLSARDADGKWVQATTTNGDTGWLNASDIVAFGMESLPVVQDGAGAAPAVAATETVTETATGAEATASPSVEATEAATDTVAPAANQPGVAGSVSSEGGRLNVRSGPGQDYRVVGKAADGADVSVIGRDESGDWLVISRSDLPGGEGWVAAQFVKLDQAVTDLPVKAAPTRPVATATPVPAASTTPEAASSAPLDATAVVTPSTATEGDAPSLSDQEQLAAMAVDVSAAPVKITGQPAAGLTGKIVFQDGRDNIYVYDLTNGDVRFLTNGFEPDVNADGTRVVYLRGGGTENGIWSINMDGTDAKMVYGTGEIVGSPKWSPKGDFIVFSRNPDSYKCFDLTPFLGCISFQQLLQKFPAPSAIRNNPILYKQYKSILYRRILSDADRLELPNWGISRVAPDGSDFRDINALDSAVAPDWNEAGIVYQSAAGLEITEDTPDGRTRSVFHGDWDWDPDWQPGGGRILYQSKEGSHWEIWSVTPEGGDIFALTRPETTLVDQMPSNVAPAWSPDGKNVVYLSNRDDDEEAGAWRLWVMDAGGGNKRPLPIDVTLDYGFGGAQVASWGL